MAIASSIIAAGIGAAGAIGGAALSSSASRSAANAQAQATQQATQFQRDALQQTRIDNAPWMYAGQTALYSLMDSLGLARPQNPIFYDPNAGPVGSQYAQGSGQGGAGQGWQGQGQGGQGSNALAQWGSGPMTQARGFQATPGYQFALNQSNDAIQNRLAALGLAGSGTALDAISKNTVGYANQEYGNYLNRLASLAGLGQTSTNNQNAATLSTANNMSNLTMQGGNQQASAIMGQANAWHSALGYLTNPAGPVMNAFSTGFGSGFGGGGSAQYISPFGRY